MAHSWDRDTDPTIYLNGRWTPSLSGRTFPVMNPADGKMLGRASDGGADDADAAVAAATIAFESWSETTAYVRSDVLRRAHDLMVAEAAGLAELMTLEQGKPLRAAQNEVRYAADFLAWFAEEAKRIYGSTIPSNRADHRFMVLRQPVGVVAAVTPWNYPISMLTRKISPALAAGCTVVLKPAEQTPFCAAAVIDILHRAGLPAGVVNLVTTSDPVPVGRAMLSAPSVRKLTFTGSTAVGKQLARDSADSVKRVSLELGGHAPFIVFADADPIHAAKGAALVKFLNTGQACICPNRLFVHRDIYDAFVGELMARAGKLRAGSGLEAGVSVGPLIDTDAMDKMVRQVADATTKGAKVQVGGVRLVDPGLEDGQFFAPTVLTEVTPDMDIYYEETFGPIAPVIPFDSEEEVIAMANDTPYGLASYLYTNDFSRAMRVSERLKFGIVGINDINPTSAAAPFGGIKESGLGREGGPNGVDEYLETKLIGMVI